ncbi:MAG: BlaI/MecI/CopY family transcriptional regulator, partial [Deltaproteobacteria bacterium]|nr:BlaI/MecI/CopY family transcriptional regulator [Deltaproteobacteria bacterium]
WKTPGLSGKEVFEELRKSRDIAVTTVFTVLERLARKGLLRKAKGESVFIFEPVQTEDELARTVSKEVLKGVLDLWSGSAMASFVDILASKDPGELDRLSRLISSKKHDLDKRPRK